MADVEYRTLDHLPGYRFGSDGSVQSRWIRGSKLHRMREEWREVKARKNSRRDYLYVTLRVAEGRKHYRVNVLVLWAFTGHRPAGLDACHKNGDRLDNRVENLEWKTRAANLADKLVHGTHRRGTLINSAKLDEPAVAQIKRVIRLGGRSYASLGRQYDVSETTIRQIAHGKNWAHVEAAS